MSCECRSKYMIQNSLLLKTLLAKQDKSRKNQYPKKNHISISVEGIQDCVGFSHLHILSDCT